MRRRASTTGRGVERIRLVRLRHKVHALVPCMFALCAFVPACAVQTGRNLGQLGLALGLLPCSSSLCPRIRIDAAIVRIQFGRMLRLVS